MANRKYHHNPHYSVEHGRCVRRAHNPKTHRKLLNKTNSVNPDNYNVRQCTVLKRVISTAGYSESSLCDGDYTEILTVKCKAYWWTDQIIQDHFATGRCTHSYDCCGNMYNDVMRPVHLKRHEWKVVIHWTRNV